MLRITAAARLLFVAPALAIAQTGGAPTEFEVAVIKPFVPPAPQAGRAMAMRKGGGGPGTSDPGQITRNGISLKNLIMTAYAVKGYQVSGPPWLDTERFSIVAKVPPGATKEQVPIMWRNLLAERFLLKLHRETREIPVYEIVPGKNGPKLKESEPPREAAKDRPDANIPPQGPMRPTFGPDGCPVFPGGRGGTSMMMMPGRFRICAKQTTIEGLAEMLTLQLNRPVFDKTGLKAKYDFKLEYEPEGSAGMMIGPAGNALMGSAAQSGPPPEGGISAVPGPEPAPPIFAAFQNQLGLKLEPKKAPAEILVIDKMEKTPTDN